MKTLLPECYPRSYLDASAASWGAQHGLGRVGGRIPLRHHKHNPSVSWDFSGRSKSEFHWSEISNSCGGCSRHHGSSLKDVRRAHGQYKLRVRITSLLGASSVSHCNSEGICRLGGPWCSEVRNRHKCEFWIFCYLCLCIGISSRIGARNRVPGEEEGAAGRRIRELSDLWRPIYSDGPACLENRRAWNLED